jgi:inhibitor of cysteine peptidase
MTSAIEVDDQANGTSVVLTVGQSLVVRLPENPTTGHRWSVESLGGMLLEGDEFLPAGIGVGAGGTRRLLLRAQKPDRTQVVFSLRRSWEAPSASIGRFTLSVNTL